MLLLKTDSFPLLQQPYQLPINYLLDIAMEVSSNMMKKLFDKKLGIEYVLTDNFEFRCFILSVQKH
jgi:hypothetical protein